MNESQKFIRWTILVAILLAGFASPFTPASCSVDFAVGFPLPYYFTKTVDAPFVWPVAVWLSLVVDALTIVLLTSVFWRLQARLINRKTLLSGLRLSVAYGILSSLICFLFNYLDKSNWQVPEFVEGVVIWPGYVFYAPLFMLGDGLRPNFSPQDEIIYARVLLLPTLALWVFVFAGLTIVVKKVVAYFYCPSCQKS